MKNKFVRFSIFLSAMAGLFVLWISTYNFLFSGIFDAKEQLSVSSVIMELVFRIFFAYINGVAMANIMEEPMKWAAEPWKNNGKVEQNKTAS